LSKEIYEKKSMANRTVNKKSNKMHNKKLMGEKKGTQHTYEYKHLLNE
jgi:hypothetical protein